MIWLESQSILSGGNGMAKSGQARVPTATEQQHVFDVILKHRYPEKNTAIMQVSFKLGLRAQEIALLQIKEVARLGKPSQRVQRSYELFKVMSLPAAYTKGSDAMGRSKATYQRKSLTFKKDEFDKAIKQVVALAQAGAEVNPESFYPPIKKHKGKSRDLPMVDAALRQALTDYLDIRLQKDPMAKPTDPLFITQKSCSYSPNTLQEHMGKILKVWAGIEKASSHSGRRSLATNIIHTQEKSVRVAQLILGHVDPSTTFRYVAPPEGTISTVLAAVAPLSRK